MTEAVNHPQHYGGDTPYEAIKVIEAWGLNFHLGNAVKYISRAGKKGNKEEDLKKALWYIQRELDKMEPKECDLSSMTPTEILAFAEHNFNAGSNAPLVFRLTGCTQHHEGAIRAFSTEDSPNIRGLGEITIQLATGMTTTYRFDEIAWIGEKEG